MFYDIYLPFEPIDFKYFRKLSADEGDKEGPGRKASDCWEIAFGSSSALAIVKAEKQTACTHCGIIVSHHKKSEAVTNHLKKCRVYKNALIHTTMLLVEWKLK